jgi:thioester reductase-like protein
MAHPGSIPETPSNDPSDASPLGYSRSKWVAEAICQQAASQTRMAGCISILRVGQLAGDMTTGVWNEKEAWPMMLSTIKLVKALPAIKDEPLNWLPVNTAAQAFIEAAVERMPSKGEEMEVVHVLNQRRETTWMDLLSWLKKDVDFETLSPEDWLARLEEAQNKGEEHPAFRLIGMWRENLCKDQSNPETNEAAASAPHFETIRSVRAAPVLANVKPADEAYLRKIWKWIDESL